MSPRIQALHVHGVSLIALASVLTTALASTHTAGQESRGFDQDLVDDPTQGPIRIRITEIASGFTGAVNGMTQFLPTDLDTIPDGSGRLCVQTLGGVIRLIDPVSGLQAEPYLVTVNSNSQVNAGLFGMTSLAFHPDFASQGSPGFGKLYTIETELQTAGTPDFDGSLVQNGFGGIHHDVVYEYTTTTPSSNVFTGSKRELLRVEQPGSDHNVVDLVFGAGSDSSNLYITSGDGANASKGVSLIRQNPQTLSNVFGKILRIHPLGTNSTNGQYGIPADNPFVGDASVLPEIYSYGHRSPYRLTVDQTTGILWLGEVGQIQIEEINQVTSGSNYGWPLKEGSFLFDETDLDNNQIDPDLDSNGTGDFADANQLTDPIFELDHQTARSITGGYVYRSDSIPDLNGNYVFADAFGNGLYYAAPADGPVSGENGNVRTFLVDPAGIQVPFGAISIGQDQDNELYLLTFDGRVLKLNAWPCNGADFFPDGALNFIDVSTFLSTYSAQSSDADLTEDGQLNFQDISAFLSIFSSGC
ncbi:MAG: PQQ-dependent sugar dehydrogenase [Phycisphaerales bacterium]